MLMHMKIQSYTNARLIMYEFLSKVVNTPPDSEFVRQICSISFDWLPEAVSHIPKCMGGAYLLSQFVRDFKNFSSMDLSLQLAVEWTRIFRGLKPGYGPPPAEASSYGNYDVAKLIEHYQQVGIRLADNRFDPDYLGVQLAFLYELVKQEYQYWKQRDIFLAISVMDKEKYFIQNYLDWVSDFYSQAQKHMSLTFYNGILSLLQEFLAEDMFWLNDVPLLVK